jgi:hypothetical protein
MFLFAAGAILAACSDPSGPGLTGVRISTRTTGTDLDRNGYRLSVNGADRGVIGTDDTVLAGLEPGSWTLALTDLSSNCAVDGPTSRDVTVVSAEVASVDFSVVCTATTGVVKIIVSPTGPAVGGESFFARIDNDDALQKQTMEAPGFVSVTIGNHVISLYGSKHCVVVGDGSKPVTVDAGSTRDTVPVEFAVTCNGPAEMTGMIWGQVLDSLGACLRGGMAEIIDGPGAGQISRQPEECDAWDYVGFEFDDLPLGDTVTLRASAPGYHPEDRQVVTRNGGAPVQFVLIPK